MKTKNQKNTYYRWARIYWAESRLKLSKLHNVTVVDIKKSKKN